MVPSPCVCTSQWRLRTRRDRGATGWYQSLGSHTFSMAGLQINVGLICNWVTRVFAIHSNYKYDVIYSFFEIYPLIPKISCSSLIPSPFQSARIWRDGGHVTVPGLPMKVRTGRTTWWGYSRGWWIASSRQSCWPKRLHSHLFRVLMITKQIRAIWY